MKGSVSKLKEKLDKAEKERSVRIEVVKIREPKTKEFFGDDKQYSDSQWDGKKFTDEYEKDKDAVINKSILEDKEVNTKDYRKKRELNPVGEAAANGKTEDKDPEIDDMIKKIIKYRKENK
jgi:hypothetical protein